MSKKEALLKVAFLGFGDNKRKGQLEAYNEYVNWINTPKNMEKLNNHLEQHAKKLFNKNLPDLKDHEWQAAYAHALNSSGAAKMRSKFLKNRGLTDADDIGI